MESGYSLVINGKKTKVQLGDTFILRLSDWHELLLNSKKERHACINIVVEQELFRETCDWLSPGLFNEMLESSDVPYCRLSASTIHDLRKRIEYPLFALRESEINDETLRQLKPIERAIVAEVLGQFLFKQGQKTSRIPECIRKLTRLLAEDENYIYYKVSQLAEILNYSQAYLCRQFSRNFGITLERYLIERRIEKSAFMLLARDVTVDQVAHASGWKKTGNFITEFKRVYGETPSRYRNQVIDSKKDVSSVQKE